MKSPQAITRLAVKQIFSSIRAEIRANEYLLESIRKMEWAKATELVEYPMIMENDIRSLNLEVRQCLKKVSDHCHLKIISDHFLMKDID